MIGIAQWMDSLPRLPGDIWECQGVHFRLVDYSDGWDGPRGWHCDPGWIGDGCFETGAKTRAHFVRRGQEHAR